MCEKRAQMVKMVEDINGNIAAKYERGEKQTEVN